MKPPASSRAPTAVILGWTLLACALLAARFSPDWVEFARTASEALGAAATPAERAAVEQTMLSGYSERGWHVLRQSRDLAATVDNPLHQIVRWRLLVPALGHVLHLPGWLTLGLAQLGCAAWVLALAALLRRPALDRGWGNAESIALILVAAAGAPLFASLGWLGYYDSLLMLALLAVAHGGHRGLVALACVLGPWIDERFVLGLPLALGVRWILAGTPRGPGLAGWLRREAAGPFALTAGYAVLRLTLGGSGGSQTTAQYLREFVFSRDIPASQRLWGAWSGLRGGWILVAVAVLAPWPGLNARTRGPRLLLAAGAVLTAVIGLVTALDLGRSMALLTPVVSLGLVLAPRLGGGSAPRWAAAALAVLTLAVPAQQVVENSAVPVDHPWGMSLAVVTAQNNLGVAYAEGRGVPVDRARALRWYTRSAELGCAESFSNWANLIVAAPERREEALALYERSLRLKPERAESRLSYAAVLAGMPGREADAIREFEHGLRLNPDVAPAHADLGALLARVPGREGDAEAHLRKAVRLQPDLVGAHNNLAMLLAGRPGQEEEVARLYQQALRLQPGQAEVHNNLGNLLARLPGRQAEGLDHLRTAARLLPSHPQVWLNLGWHLERTGDRGPETRAAYARALELNPAMTAAQDALRRLDSGRGK